MEFAEFVRQHSGSLYATALLLTGSRADAEDLLQSVLTALYPKWSTVTRADVPVAYVRRSLVNRFLSQRRLKAATAVVTADVPERSEADATAQVADRDALRGLLARLPAKQRAAIVLRYYEDWDEPSIADALGVRPGTVRTLVSRGLQSLRTSPDLEDVAGRRDDA